MSDRLDLIETDWSMVFEPAHIVMRYAHAVQCYLDVLLGDKHDAEDAAQEFFLFVSAHGLPRASRDRGRFRDYLKKVVRNKALNFVRDQGARHRPSANLANIPEAEDRRSNSDQEWLVQWRRCLLTRAWQRLQEQQKRAPNRHYFTVLCLCATYPDESSEQLAARASSYEGDTLGADTFRKQVSRARRVFAKLLVDEVAQTIDYPSPSDIEEELADLGLMKYVSRYLPIRQRCQV
jgi:RNA polymerase sigma-70 factor (ECF subfamily)